MDVVVGDEVGGVRAGCYDYFWTRVVGGEGGEEGGEVGGEIGVPEVDGGGDWSTVARRMWGVRGVMVRVPWPGDVLGPVLLGKEGAGAGAGNGAGAA